MTEHRPTQPRPIASARIAPPPDAHGDEHEQAYNAYRAEGKTHGEAFDLMLAYIARTRAAKRVAT